MQARFQIAAMEGVLERAVQLGARRLSQQVQAVSPDSSFIAGAARAKGFWLDGYGVFFDVDVPAMRRSVAWSFRALERPDRATEAAIQTLRRNLAVVRDPQARREMEEALAAALAHRRTADAAGPAPDRLRACPWSRPARRALSKRRRRRRPRQRPTRRPPRPWTIQVRRTPTK